MERCSKALSRPQPGHGGEKRILYLAMPCLTSLYAVRQANPRQLALYISASKAFGAA